MLGEELRDDYEHPATVRGVFYCVTRTAGRGAPRELQLDFASGCSCADSDCTSSTHCSCLRQGPNYRHHDNTLTLHPDKPHDAIVFECHPQCACSKTCPNRCVQLGPNPSLEVFLTERKGWGLRTSKPLPAGCFVSEYAGEVIGVQEVELREARRGGDMNYVFVLTESWDKGQCVTCVDPTFVGNIGRYVNHSCEPNCFVLPVRVNNSVPHLCIFTKRVVEAGEELCYSYSGGARSDTSSDRKPCYCTAPSCCGTLPFNLHS